VMGKELNLIAGYIKARTGAIYDASLKAVR
jgi:hypothetical protein